LSFDKALVKETVAEFVTDKPKEQRLDIAFIEICTFLYDNPDRLSWRSRNKPNVTDKNGLKALAKKFFNGFRRSDFPAEPGTIPDEMVSIVMQQA
jgi:hypothetical protein